MRQFAFVMTGSGDFDYGQGLMKDLVVALNAAGAKVNPWYLGPGDMDMRCGWLNHVFGPGGALGSTEPMLPGQQAPVPYLFPNSFMCAVFGTCPEKGIVMGNGYNVETNVDKTAERFIFTNRIQNQRCTPVYGAAGSGDSAEAPAEAVQAA